MTTQEGFIITIDGPSGAGKSTAARMLAEALGYTLVDSGAMYRGIAVAYRDKQANAGLEEFLAGLRLRFEFGAETRVWLDGRDVTAEIRDPEISLLASRLSQHGRVRQYLTDKQREVGAGGRVVLEGRDTGTVVFPDAQVKFYLDASPRERARRRYLELRSSGAEVDFAKVLEEMFLRDKNDSEREIAPLRVPRDAVIINTDGVGPEAVLAILLGAVKEKRAQWRS